MQEPDIGALETRTIDVPEHVTNWIRKVIREERLSTFPQLDEYWVLNSERYQFPEVPPEMYSTAALASLGEDLLEENDPLAPEAEVLEWLEDHEGYIVVEWS